MARSTEAVFKRDDSPFWYAWVPDPRTGKAVARSTRCRTQGEAVAWRRRFIRAEQDPADQAARSVTLEAVLNAFLESRDVKRTAKGRALSEGTREFYQHKASMVAAVLGATTLASKVNAPMVDGYIATRRTHKTKGGSLVVDSTIAKELAVLRAALKLAKRQGNWRGELDAIFPSAGDFSPGYDPKKASERALARLDVAKLAVVMKPAKFAVLAFAIATSAEMAALATATRGDVAPDRSSVRVRGTKNERRDREVPIATLEQALLLDFAMKHAPGTGELLFPSLSNIRRDLAEAARAAGVHHFSPHNVRHTLARWLAAGGVHSAIIGAVLGHGDGRMAERTYAHLRHVEDVRSAVLAQYRPHTETTVGFLLGKADEHGEDGDADTASPPRGTPIFQGDVVLRPRVELGTPGFSIQPENPGSTEGSDGSEPSLLGFCKASDPDAALKDAIHAAIEAGLYDRARALLDVLAKTSAPAEVVDIRERSR